MSLGLFLLLWTKSQVCVPVCVREKEAEACIWGSPDVLPPSTGERPHMCVWCVLEGARGGRGSMGRWGQAWGKREWKAERLKFLSQAWSKASVWSTASFWSGPSTEQQTGQLWPHKAELQSKNPYQTFSLQNLPVKSYLWCGLSYELISQWSGPALWDYFMILSYWRVRHWKGDNFELPGP